MNLELPRNSGVDQLFLPNVVRALGMSLVDAATRNRLGALTQHFMSQGSDAVTAARQAAVGHTIHAQATLMGFGDTFGLLGVMLLLAALSVVLLKKAKGPASAAAH